MALQSGSHTAGPTARYGLRLCLGAIKKTGQGKQEIKNITEGERIDLEIRFERHFAGIASTPLTTEAVTPARPMSPGVGYEQRHERHAAVHEYGQPAG